MLARRCLHGGACAGGACVGDACTEVLAWGMLAQECLRGRCLHGGACTGMLVASKGCSIASPVASNGDACAEVLARKCFHGRCDLHVLSDLMSPYTMLRSLKTCTRGLIRLPTNDPSHTWVSWLCAYSHQAEAVKIIRCARSFEPMTSYAMLRPSKT